MSSLTRLLHRAFSSTAQSNATPSIKSLCDSLNKERNLKSLVEKFKRSCEVDRFRTKTGIYESTVRRLAAAKRFRWIEEILEEQKKYSNISKEGFSARLISLYGKSGMYENAQKVFDEMPDRNCQRTVLSLNALLAACVNSKKLEKVDELFRELPSKLSIELDSVSYNTVIKAYCEKGSLDSAVSLLDEMEKKGLEPDNFTFNILLNALYGNGRFSDGEKVWGRMVDKNIAPDIRTFNSKLQGLASEKKTKEAVELIEEMESKGIAPNVFCLNAVIKGFINEGNLHEAKQWYNKIQERNFNPDKTTFALLIPFACEKGDVEFAFELCKDVFNIKCLVDGEILQLAVDGLVKGSKIQEAKKVVQLGARNCYCKYKLQLPSES